MPRQETKKTDTSSLQLDHIYKGDSREILTTLPEKSVDLIFADPPYNLQLQNTLLRPNLTVVDAVDDEWDQFDDFAAYDEFTREWLTACKRVLKDTGTLWVIGSYHNIYRVGSILQDLGYWILNDVVWVKCLAGNTELFVLLNEKPIVIALKDLARLSPRSNSIKLPSYDENGCLTWVEVVGWGKTEKTHGLYIVLEDGSSVECTNEHQFPVMRAGEIVMVSADHLQAGDTLIQLGHFELPQVIQSDAMDYAMGEFIGWYLAEGSFLVDDKGVVLALSGDEREQATRLIQLIQKRLGIVGRIHQYDNCIHLIFPGRLIKEFIKRFVRGENAKTKRLTQNAFLYGIDFLRGVLDGYLAGDGHWEVKSQRWRIGLTRNSGLMYDLSVICRLTQKRLRFFEAVIAYQRGQSEIFRGEIRENEGDTFTYVSMNELGLPSRRHFSTEQRYSLSQLRQKYKWSTRKTPTLEPFPDLANAVFFGDLRPIKIKEIHQGTLRHFHDVAVTGNHVFALANGLLTHNSNPMPNFRGVRYGNAHETLLWCKKSKDQKKYTFNYHAMKMANDEKQMRSDWEIPLCTGSERLMVNGEKLHATQKPEALLYRVILSSSNPGDVVLDPFFGTGTTGAVAKKLGRHFVGIEREEKYIQGAQARINAIPIPMFSDEVYGQYETKRSAPRIAFTALLENSLLSPGQTLFFDKQRDKIATLLADGALKTDTGERGSIHKIGALVGKMSACNGWEHWYYEDSDGSLQVIDMLRQRLRKQNVEEVVTLTG